MNDLDALFDAHMALGLVLDYPGSDWPQRLEAIESAQLPASVAHHLDKFVRIAQQWGHTRLQEHYVATFDNKRKCSLYVTYFNLGDTRRRGAALLNFADLFKAVGFEPPEFELPDYLPLLLQLSAQSKDVVVSEVLAAVHPGIEVTRTAVAGLKSPYVHVFDALAATLPKLTDDQRNHVLRIINQGPPTELVGLSSKQLPIFVKGSS